MSKKILITGASGLIGASLTNQLQTLNHSVVHLGRRKKEGKVASFVWDVTKNQIDQEALTSIDTIVHLAGASVGDKRWTASWKKEILDSRVQSTKILFDSLKKNKNSVKTFISASAIGYYGFEGDSVFTEDSPPGNDFLAQVTKQWEEEVDKISSLGIRVVKIRIGIVLSEKGGALEKIVQPIKFGVGSPLGSGQQYLSWIHLDDLCHIFIKAIEDETMNGAYNASANWATNAEMTRVIAEMLNKPLLLPNAPSFALRIILGEMADIVLNGSKVSSSKIKEAGFSFLFSDLNKALKNLLVP
jgi:hypothetical protein